MFSRQRAAIVVSAVAVVVLVVAVLLNASGGRHGRTSVSAGDATVPSTATSNPVSGQGAVTAPAATDTSTTSTSAVPTTATADTVSSDPSTSDTEPAAPIEPTTTTAPPVPAYGPDALLFLTQDEPVHYSVWAINPDGSDKTMLTSGVDAWYVEWAPGHQQFLWGSVNVFEDGRHLHILNADGSGERELVQRPVGGDFYPFYGFAWSPDGRSIAEFCNSHSDWQVRDLCVVDVATGELHDLVKEYGLVDPEDRNEWGEAPSISFGDWDPSGDRLSYFVYTSDSTGERTSMGVLDLRSGTHTKVTAATYGGVFTSDGQSLLYQTAADSPLYRIPVDGGAPEEVPGVASNPVSRSPDGQWYLIKKASSDPLGWARTNLQGDVEQLGFLQGGTLQVSW